MSILPQLNHSSAPSYQLTIGGLLAGVTLKDRLLSLRVTLNNGHSSDQLSMEFDDRPALLNGAISLPKPGKSIKVSMGYALYQVPMGIFIANQTDLSGSTGGRTLSVSATPELMLTESARTWAGKTLANIVKTIAQKHGLSAAISPAFATTTLEAINQSNESDLAFLTRLAERYNAVCKPMAGKLLFMQKGQGTSASGLPMLPIPVQPHNVQQWRTQLAKRQDYSKVIAYYPDRVNARYSEAIVSAGLSLTTSSNKNIFRLPHLFNTEAEAKAAAKAKFDDLNRDETTLSMTLLGNPDITAEGAILVSGLRSGVNGKWIVKSATHSFSSGGYQTSIQAYR